MKKFTIFSIAAVCYALTLSCTDSILNRPADTPDESSVTKSSPEVPLAQNSTPMVLGEKLNNPYALEVMQAAVESLTPADKPVPTLMVTDLYVRFLPKDSTELAILYDVEKLELFDYPLDYEIMVEGDYYHDPSIPEGNPTWLYTTVAPDYEFPDVEYEILETCYIPQEVSVKSSSSDTFSPEDLEREAYRLAGLDSMWIDGPLTRAAEYPSGKFTVYDTETQEYVPVKGVKIRVHNINTPTRTAATRSERSTGQMSTMLWFSKTQRDSRSGATGPCLPRQTTICASIATPAIPTTLAPAPMLGTGPQ